MRKDIYLVKNVSMNFEVISDEDMSKKHDDYILLGTGVAEITMVEEDPRIKEAEALENRKKQLMAEHQVQIEKLDERIQSLLAITHEPEGS